MDTAPVNGTTLAYEIRGAGEPVMLLHCGFVAHSFDPLLREGSLTQRYRLINYHRRGYGGSGPAPASFSLDAQAADCLALMDAFDIEREHVVSHSFGANIGLELVRQAPDRIGTLTLIEPPLGFALSAASAQVFGSVIGQALTAFAAGDVETAVNEWLNGAFGPGWQAVVNRKLPGGYPQIVQDGATALGVEAAALHMWAYGPPDLTQIRQPVLALYHRDPRFGIFDDIQHMLVEHIPHIQSSAIPYVTHLMQIEDSRSVAERVASFLKDHPLPMRS